MITGSGPSPLPPRKPRPNNRKPLTAALPARRTTPIVHVNPSQFTTVNAYNNNPFQNTAAPAAVGQKSARPYHYATSLESPIPKTKPIVPHRFFTGLSRVVLPLSGFDPSNISSNYGPRINPVTGRASNHTGIDLPGTAGTPVLAAANGIVLGAVAGDPIYGNQVILAHGRKKNTMYGHMTNFIVEEGQRVKAGDVIGYVGSTGMSTGPHLHWETWANGHPVNPMVFIGGN